MAFLVRLLLVVFVAAAVAMTGDALTGGDRATLRLRVQTIVTGSGPPRPYRIVFEDGLDLLPSISVRRSPSGLAWLLEVDWEGQVSLPQRLAILVPPSSDRDVGAYSLLVRVDDGFWRCEFWFAEGRIINHMRIRRDENGRIAVDKKRREGIGKALCYDVRNGYTGIGY